MAKTRRKRQPDRWTEQDVRTLMVKLIERFPSDFLVFTAFHMLDAYAHSIKAKS